MSLLGRFSFGGGKMNARSLLVFAVLAAVSFVTVQGRASEEKVQPKDLPKKVTDALNARFPNLTISSAVKEKESDGTIVFDVELKQKDRKFETDIKEDGVMLEIEKEVISQDWSKALRETIESNHPKAKISEVMEVNKIINQDEIPDHLEITIETPDSNTMEILTSIDGKSIRSDEQSESTAASGDEKVQTQDLPKAIVEALSKKFPKSEITGAEKGAEDGQQVYEVTVKSDKHSIDVTLTSKGEILSFEKLLSESERPAALNRTVSSKYPHATIERTEEVWKKDVLTGYEATVVTADHQTVEVDLDPHGIMINDEK
jgi:uncharacterized membrane protein YkoI